MNHEFDVVFFAKSLHELESKTAQAVFVENHEFCETVSVYGVQKGLDLGSFPVESGSDVVDDLISWVEGLEELNLSLEVWSLVLRRSPSVAHLRLLDGLLVGVWVAFPLHRSSSVDISSNVFDSEKTFASW